MRKLLLAFLATCCAGTSYGQGADCISSTPVTPTASCVPANYTSDSLESWFSFVATSEFVNIEVVTTKFGVDAPHIHHVALLSGSCGGLQTVAEDELPFCSDAEKLSIDLDASNLTVGNTYYVRLDRHTSGVVPCDKTTCFPVSGSVSFDLCIEALDLLIPPDLFGELPTMSHVYYQNRGQLLHSDGSAANEVQLYTLNSSPNVMLGEDLVSFVFGKTGPMTPDVLEGNDTIDIDLDSLFRVDLKHVGANIGAQAFKSEEVENKLNYFVPHAPQGITNNKGFNRVVCQKIYPGIDMQFYSSQTGTKFYYIVNQGGDPSNISLNFAGAQAVNVVNGGIEIVTPLGDMSFEAGHVYQLDASGNIVPLPWSADFVGTGLNTVKFSLQEYNPSLPLIIQVDRGGHGAAPPPAIDNMLWSTFWGTDGNDAFFDVTTDAVGNVYYGGYTQNSQFPGASGSILAYSGSTDAIVIKLNDIVEPQWANFFGGSDQERVNGIEVAPNGDVVFVGRSASLDMPTSTTAGIYLDNANNSIPQIFYDGFIAEFSADGSVLQWATYYGGDTENESLGDLAITPNDVIYAVGTGVFGSTDLETQAGAFNDTESGGLILKFDGLRDREWATLIGGGLVAVKLDNSNNVYVAGGSSGLQYPTLSAGGTIQSANAGGSDVVVSKFDGNSNALVWSTYWGGNSVENIYDAAIDVNSNSLYVVGGTRTSDTAAVPFPTVEFNSTATNDFFEPTWQSTVLQFNLPAYDAFILRFDLTTNEPEWSTYYGGFSEDNAYAVTVDDNSYVYVVGSTRSGINNSGAVGLQTKIHFPPFAPNGFYVQDNISEDPASTHDGFMASFTPQLELAWTTYYGRGLQGSVDDRILDAVAGVAVYQDQLYLAGYSYENLIIDNVPPTKFDPSAGAQDYYQPSPSFGVEGLAARFDLSNQIILSSESIDLGINQLYLYPNPTASFVDIEIRIESSGTGVISVYDATGKEILVNQYSYLRGNNRTTIDVSNFASGIYILQVQVGNKLLTKKFVKE